MHRTSRSSHTPRFKNHVYALPQHVATHQFGPPCFEMFVMGGHTSAISSLNRCFGARRVNATQSFFSRKLARRITFTPLFFFLTLNDVTKRPPCKWFTGQRICASSLRKALFGWDGVCSVGTSSGSNLSTHFCMSVCISSSEGFHLRQRLSTPWWLFRSHQSFLSS